MEKKHCKLTLKVLPSTYLFCTEVNIYSEWLNKAYLIQTGIF